VDNYLSHQVKRFYIIILLLLIAGWTLIACNKIFVHKTHADGKTLCLIKTITGYPCPACGVSRGIGRLTRLDVKGALWQNPFSLIVAFGGLIMPFWIIYDALNKKTSLYLVNQKLGHWLKKNPYIIVLLVVFVLVNWIWNFTKY